MLKSLLSVMALVLVLAVSCKNKSDNSGMQPDSSMVVPPTKKIQDSTSLTDTSYRIGDSVR